MEKRKPRESCIADELALAKSAAWAWLEHCSGSDDRTTPEFDVSRTKFNPKPSRYKVEAMKRTSNSMDAPLLDRYEIERISRQLEFCIKSSHHGGGRRAAEDIKRKKKKKMSKGFSLLVSHAVACGSSMNDEAAAYSRRPENDSVAVVEVGCRPWQGIRAQSSGVV